VRAPAIVAPVLMVPGLLLGGCAAAPPEVAPGGAAVTAAGLVRFVGHGLTFSERGSFGLADARLADATDAPGGALLRVSYPAGSASRRAGGGGGMQAYLRLPGASPSVDELTLSYAVRFPAGFDFVKGGKLPGLFGGDVTGGRRIPDGTDGFSTRYMWRAGGAGEVYAYLPTSQAHGTSLGRGCWRFEPGRWSTIRQHVRLNTPGTADGTVTVWQDGREVLAATGLLFRTTPELGIEGVFFSTFFGGGDASWASPVDQHADFADFQVSAAAPAGVREGAATCSDAS
jgi:hypothetical protein